MENDDELRGDFEYSDEVFARWDAIGGPIPAGSLRAAGKIFAVHDTQGHQMFFITSEHGSLYVVLRGQDGITENLDLSSRFGLQEDQSITALAVTQNSQDKRINLVFSVRHERLHPVAELWSSRLYVVEPMEATREAWLPLSLQDRLYKSSEDISHYNIRKITLVGISSISDNMYPQIHVEHIHIKYYDQGGIWAMWARPSERRWFLQREFRIPDHVSNIIDTCPAASGNYRGLYILYKGRGLAFVGLDRTDPHPMLMSHSQSAPNGATKLAGLMKGDDTIDLLVSGEKLTFRTYSDFRYLRSPFTVISDDPCMAQATQLHANMNEGILQVCALRAQSRAQSALYCQSFVSPNAEPPSPTARAIPLLENAHGQNPFVTFSAHGSGQELILVEDSDSGTPKLFVYDKKTNTWNSPVKMVLPPIIVQPPAWKIKLCIIQLSHFYIPYAKHVLTSSVPSKLFVNGREMKISREGVKVKADENGLYEIIVRPVGSQVPLITLKNGRTGRYIQNWEKKIDPTAITDKDNLGDLMDMVRQKMKRLRDGSNPNLKEP